MIVEQSIFAGALEQSFGFIKRGAQRPVGANDVNHRLNITLHPVNNAPIPRTVTRERSVL